MTCLLAYDAAGNVVATLDEMVVRDADDNVLGLLDVEAYEASGARLRDLWLAENVTLSAGGTEVRTPHTGSTTWPEHLSGRVYDFRVELEPGPGGRPWARSLVHKISGYRRERENAIDDTKPLIVDDDGKTVNRTPVKRPYLPIIQRRGTSNA